MHLRLRVVAALATTALALVATTAAFGARHSFSATCFHPISNGTELHGTCSSKPWGKVRVDGVIHIPKVDRLTFKLKGGTATMSYTGNQQGSNVSGKWKWIKGTGKYKGIKGGGTLTGDLVGHYKYKGSANY